MLYLIGIGFKPSDITIGGRDIANNCDEVYLEGYTSIYDKEALGKVLSFKELSREEVEGLSFLKSARDKEVALLIPGDPLVATTHSSIVLEANENNIPIKVVHAPSIYSAIAETGLHIYKFGKTTSIPMHKDGYAPTSFLETIKENLSIKAHTLVLLDIGMTASKGCEMLSSLGDIKIVAAHIGDETKIVFGPIDKISQMELKQPSCIIVPAKLHFTEEEFLDLYKV
jgi:diphthine synthase